MFGLLQDWHNHY